MTRFGTQPQIQKLPVRATTDLTGNIYGKLKVLGFYGLYRGTISGYVCVNAGGIRALTGSS